MDFESIENLTDEEIIGLYNEAETDDVYIGGCCCRAGMGPCLTFGTSTEYDACTFKRSGSITFKRCGTCSIQILSQAACFTWCSTHRLGLNGTGFYTNECYCAQNGIQGTSSWKNCYR